MKKFYILLLFFSFTGLANAGSYTLNTTVAQDEKLAEIAADEGHATIGALLLNTVVGHIYDSLRKKDNIRKSQIHRKWGNLTDEQKNSIEAITDQ